MNPGGSGRTERVLGPGRCTSPAEIRCAASDQAGRQARTFTGGGATPPRD
ncbi:hypothetical protein ACFPRL_09855 [Pseudoclavibacter helvolus]